MEDRDAIQDMEERIMRLEETVALQGKTIDDLSDVIASQQRQLDDDERLLKAAVTRLRALWEMNDAQELPPDEKPPHY